MKHLALLLATMAASACQVEENANRAAWLHATLVADRFGDLQRNPELVAAQFDRMQEDPYSFLRGTLPQYRRDVTEPFSINSETHFLTEASSRIQLVGDPHIENIGTYQNRSGEIVVEFNDFDSAIYGPYHADVWRLALSWYAFGASTTFSKTEPQDWLAAGEQVARGYADEILAMAAGSETPPLTDSAVFEDLVEEAQENGNELADLKEFTVVDDDDLRRFDRENPEILSLNAPITAWINESIPTWLSILPDEGRELGALKDVSRRLGSGVASLFLQRYYLLFEGASESPDDDLLIEWKETRDPCLIGTGIVEAARLFTSNAQRVTVLQRRAHADPMTDPYSGWLGEEPWSFRSRRNSGFHQGIGRNRIQRRLRNGLWGREELEAAGYATGQLLARTHARPQTMDETSALDAIADVLEGRTDEFVAEARERINLMGPQLVDDFRLFSILREQHGPALDLR